MDAAHNDDKPYTLPAPMVVADRAEQRAWDDDCDDVSRLVLEMAADTIRQLMTRCVTLAAAAERVEAGRQP
jgi:hypothetical protein